MEISITFNDKNNYGRVVKDVREHPEDPIINAFWFAKCAMAAIEQAYPSKNAPRRIEMEKLYTNVLYQIKKQLSEEQQKKYYKYLRPITPEATTVEK